MKQIILFFVFISLSYFSSEAQKNAHVLWEKDVVDTCIVIPFGVDFGACAMPLGWALCDSGCVMLSGCSMIGSNGIDYSTSFFPSSYQCNNACVMDTSILINCIDPTQIDSSICCITVYDPVCGCDSVTYTNSCVATFYGGVSAYTTGACPNAGIVDSWMTRMTIQPNPFTSKWTLFCDPSLNLAVRLIQSDGVVRLTQQSSSILLEFDGENLASGVYIVEITNRQNGQKMVKRIVKE